MFSLFPSLVRFPDSSPGLHRWSTPCRGCATCRRPAASSLPPPTSWYSWPRRRSSPAVSHFTLSLYYTLYYEASRQRTHLCYPGRLQQNNISHLNKLQTLTNKCSRVVLHIKGDYRCQSFRGSIFSSVPIIILSSKRLNLNFSLIASFHLLALLSWINFFIRSGTKKNWYFFCEILGGGDLKYYTDLYRLNYVNECLFL